MRQKQPKAVNLQSGKTWHEQHLEQRTVGQRASDGVAKWMGSWTYIIFTAVFITVYITGNVVALVKFDKYPFILLNLILAILLLFGAPLIMMSQNRQEQKDRLEAERDYENDERAKEIIEKMDKAWARMEAKIDALCDQAGLGDK